MKKKVYVLIISLITYVSKIWPANALFINVFDVSYDVR